VDDGVGGDFRPVVGFYEDYLLLYYTVTVGIVPATNYRFRFRAKNVVGWGEYSVIAYVLAASVPARPP
jgi:hypothetical protein